MNWIVLALIAYFLWSLSNLGDKYVLGNKIKNPYVYLVLLTFFGLLSIVLIPFVNFFVPENNLLLWLILGGALYFYGGLFYVKSVQLEDITRINIWWNLIPFFTLIISWLTINEHLTTNQCIAFIILAVGSILASINFSNKKISLSKAFPLMIIATLAYSGYAVILRYVTQSIPFSVAYIWSGIIMAMFSLTLFILPSLRRDFFESTRKINSKLGVILAAIFIFEQLGTLFNIWALSLGPVSLIFALEGTQTISVFLLVLIISRFRPDWLKEKTGKSNMILKIVALVLILIGIIMVNI